MIQKLKNLKLKIKITKTNQLYEIKNFLLILIGTIVLAFGTSIFILPFNLIIGGISSYALIFSKLLSIDFLTVEVLIPIITWLLFFLGLIILGKKFTIKTLLSAIVYPVFIPIFSNLVNPDVLGGIFYLNNPDYSSIAPMLAAVFGGFLVGTGCAIAFVGGGSTGGTDILAFIICKYVKSAKSSVIIFLIDAIAVLLGIFVFKDLPLCLLGILSAFIGAVAIDRFTIDESKAVIVQIISEKYDKINQEVLYILERSTSIIKITGGYTGTEQKMLIVSLTTNEYTTLMKIINRIDPTAFIMVNRAHKISGLGWTR